MKSIYLVLAFLFIQTSWAQNDVDQNNIVMDFATGYNYLSPNMIYNLLDENYQKEFTLGKIDEFVETHDKVLGMIEDCRFLSVQDNTRSYIMQGEKSVMIVKFEFSEENTITSMKTQILANSIPTF